MNGCVSSDDICPPFPAPDTHVSEELKLCPLDEMPHLLDWMNKLSVLQEQLNT